MKEQCFWTVKRFDGLFSSSYFGRTRKQVIGAYERTNYFGSWEHNRTRGLVKAVRVKLVEVD